MNSFYSFASQFIQCLTMVRGVIIGLLSLILTGGIMFSLIEGLPISESIYFSFVTALTVGFGDIVPLTPLGRLLSVLIGVIGMIFFGVIIGISTRIIIRQMHPEEFIERHK